DRRARDRGARPVARRRSGADRRLHGDAAPDLRAAALRPGDGREGPGGGAFHDARVSAGDTLERKGLLGLGSNVGDRRTNLQAALDALPGAGVRVLASSSTYDTDPVGEVLDQPSFLNACVLVETALEPLALLDAVKELEAQLGRAAGGVRHGPR